MVPEKISYHYLIDTIKYPNGETGKNWSNNFDFLTPQYWALGNYNIHAIPEGRVIPAGNNQYWICVDKFYYTVVDTFNFEELQYLGHWPLNPDEEARSGINVLTPLYNSDFRNFRRHGYGREFPVLSKLHEAENFVPVCWKHTYGK